ncbi:MAG: SLC13 family permease, partial [Notoacmeibacter sp.]
MGLLFPSVILLSAGGSLIGAGAHLIAIDAMVRAGYAGLSFSGWILLAFPFAILSSLAATLLILKLFVPSDLRSVKLQMQKLETKPLDVQQKRLAFGLVVLIALWVLEPFHGFGVAITALAGAMFFITPVFTAKKPKEIFKGIEMELILFLTATVVLAEALSVSGADKWLAAGALGILPQSMTGSLTVVTVFIAMIAIASHLFITSRSARAAVLIPALALPIAAFGHDMRLIVLVTVLGTGFCQTMMASAKPVAIFGQAQPAPFVQADLTRLAMPLMPVVTAILIVFALAIWPRQLGPATIVTPVAPRVAEHTIKIIEPVMDGALCTRSQLKTVMLAQISDRKMWASGWWHVWNRLQRAGLPVERDAV